MEKHFDYPNKTCSADPLDETVLVAELAGEGGGEAASCWLDFLGEKRNCDVAAALSKSAC